MAHVWQGMLDKRFLVQYGRVNMIFIDIETLISMIILHVKWKWWWCVTGVPEAHDSPWYHLTFLMNMSWQHLDMRHTSYIEVSPQAQQANSTRTLCYSKTLQLITTTMIRCRYIHVYIDVFTIRKSGAAHHITINTSDIITDLNFEHVCTVRW